MSQTVLFLETTKPNLFNSRVIPVSQNRDKHQKLNIFREGVGGRASKSAAPGSNLGAPFPSEDVKPIEVVLGEDVISGRTVVLCKWIVASTRKKY